jgi:hypothetical protein
MTTGLTFALAAGSLIATSGMALPIPAMCLTLWAVVLAAVYVSREPIMLVRIVWFASAALIALAVAWNGALAASGNATSWLVNAILVACALGLILAAVRLTSATTDRAPDDMIGEVQPAE